MGEDDDLPVMLAARSLNKCLEALVVVGEDLGCLAGHRRSVAPIVRSPEQGMVVAVPDLVQDLSDMVKAPFSRQEKTFLSCFVIGRKTFQLFTYG